MVLDVDFLIIDQKNNPVAVVEIDGYAHNPKSDTAKERILKSADIACLRVNIADFNQYKTHTDYNAFVQERIAQSVMPFFQNSAQGLRTGKIKPAKAG